MRNGREKEAPSVRSIASTLGLSPATVSLALNGRKPTSYVSIATRQQVWKAAAEMGYPLDRLRSRRALIDRAGIFTLSSRNSVYSASVLEICRALNEHRVQVLVHSLRSNREAYTMTADLYKRQEIDAAVFVGSRDEMPSLDINSVFVGEVPDDAKVWQVRTDNEGGGRYVGEHLWSLGHRSVAYITSTLPNSVGERRLSGFRAYFEEHGGSIPAENVLHTDIDSESALRQDVVSLLERNSQSESPVTAIFCYNDWVAGMVLKLLRYYGKRIPEEISVVGFDDGVYAELLDPPLTTIQNPFTQMGSMAAELLLQQVETPDAEPRVLVARCRLIGRQSCGPAPLTS
jgi:DNA-binding LacI/PurR family transcriptional regulator